MKKNLSVIIPVLAFLAVVTQYYLMLKNQVTPPVEATIRFFSYFTILTNSLVAVYFTLRQAESGKDQPGTLTAVTLYITVVGLIYQVVLRHTWAPAGLQKIVDELLHTIIPVLVIFFWYRYEDKAILEYRQIPRWLIYPLVYLVYVLIRGNLSGFYPYPFIDVKAIGWSAAGINSVAITVLFVVISAIFIKIGKSKVFL